MLFILDKESPTGFGEVKSPLRLIVIQGRKPLLQ